MNLQIDLQQANPQLEKKELENNVNNLFDAAFAGTISESDFDAALEDQLHKIAYQRYLNGLQLSPNQQLLLGLES